jgi:hypothetical protein
VRDESASGGCVHFFGKSTSDLRALPGFNLPQCIDFGQIKNCATGNARASAGPELVKLLINPIRVTVYVAKNPSAVAPLADVVRPDGFGFFLKHHSDHARMMHVA